MPYKNRIEKVEKEIEQVSHKPIADVIENYICDDLGMNIGLNSDVTQ